jgi:phosphate-selective porin OprO/OprP
VLLKYKGFSLLAEYANKSMTGGRVEDTGGSIINNYYTGTGLNVQAGYLLKNNLEPSIRVTTITPELESGRDLQEMITFGLSKYIKGHSLKVQTDFSILTETNQVDKTLMFRFQVEMAF